MKAEELWHEYLAVKDKALCYFFDLMKKFEDSIRLNGRRNSDEYLCIFDGEYVKSIFEGTIKTTDGCEYYADDLNICDLIHICDFLETYEKPAEDDEEDEVE